MILDDFYRVLDYKSNDVNSFEMTVEIKKNHDIFKGHFPNFPVTPGIAMVQIIKNGMESHLLQPLQLQSASQIKFLKLVNPEENAFLIFNIQFTFENNHIKVKNTTSFKDESAVLKCNVTFVKK